jgi:hypothetical protein
MGNRSNNILVIILVILLLLLSGLSYYFYDSLSTLETELLIIEQNNVALTDTIQKTKNKVGDIESSKTVLVSQNKNLSNLNKGLDSELKKERGKVSQLTTTVVSLQSELGKLKSGVSGGIDVDSIPETKDSEYRIDWELDKVYNEDNKRFLSGYTTFNLNLDDYTLYNVNSVLLKDDITFKLVQGLRERNGLVEVFARSEYGGFEVDDLNSVIIDPETHPVFSKFTKKSKNKIKLGAFLGYGVAYNFKRSEALDGLLLGVGLNYSFF